MEIVRNLATAREDADNLGAARTRRLVTFEDKGASTLSHHETIAIFRKRAHGRIWWVVPRRERGEQ